jgi:hypothetical protein
MFGVLLSVHAQEENSQATLSWSQLAKHPVDEPKFRQKYALELVQSLDSKRLAKLAENFKVMQSLEKRKQPYRYGTMCSGLDVVHDSFEDRYS